LVFCGVAASFSRKLASIFRSSHWSHAIITALAVCLTCQVVYQPRSLLLSTI
jgi:hypothetical protein